ncbi:MAG TPA: hypothetical protein VNT99_09220, partial [Methylomirabilota bacterium]|nr:hypothetical protein [Methylomirabilota bacterium]
YPADVFIAQFEKVANGFGAGVATLSRHLPIKSDSEGDDALRNEVRIARAAELHFRSVANQARFIVARDALAKASAAQEAEKHLTALEHLLRGEIELARQLYAIQRADSRIGFEASNQYYYVPADLIEKVLNCADLLDRWLPEQRQKWKL